MSRFDVAIIGAGMAGASVAAELAPFCKVVLLEAEAQPGYHATGRSAAFWSETYGGPWVQPLTSASGPWLAHPPTEFSETGFLTPRGEINIGRRQDRHALDAFAAEFKGSGIALDRLDRAAIDAQFDGFKPEWSSGIGIQSCADIDVAALNQACLRAARRNGAELHCNAQVQALSRNRHGWQIETARGAFNADMIVNAVGAWADQVGALAGARALGITPYRRTILQVRLDIAAPLTVPLIIDINGGFYFKSDGAGGLWLSPHDETPSLPVDAAPEEIDIAIAIARFEEATTLTVAAVTHKWAGLRSFAPDRLPVYGFDPQVTGLYWCAGQGGFGIQTAPAAAKLVASQILRREADPMIASLDPKRYAPSRFT